MAQPQISGGRTARGAQDAKDPGRNFQGTSRLLSHEEMRVWTIMATIKRGARKREMEMGQAKESNNHLDTDKKKKGKSKFSVK